MKVVPSKRQVPKPTKFLEGIGNRGSGALITEHSDDVNK